MYKTILLVIAAFFIFACKSPQTATQSAASASASPASSSDPGTEASGAGGKKEPVNFEKFFPVDIGTTWEYDVKFSGTKYTDQPLRHEVSVWPLGGGVAQAVETRGIILSGMSSQNSTPKGKLIFNLTGEASKQGPLNYPRGYELKVTQDDMGIYEGTTGTIFWAIPHDSFQITEIRELNPSSSPGAPRGSFGDYGSEPGYAMRVVFFIARPGISIGLKQQNDSLLFMDATQCSSGEPCLYFVREVKAKENVRGENSQLDSAFEEHMWFGLNRGLIRLVQKVGGKETMKWDLVKKTSLTRGVVQ